MQAFIRGHLLEANMMANKWAAVGCRKPCACASHKPTHPASGPAVHRSELANTLSAPPAARCSRLGLARLQSPQDDNVRARDQKRDVRGWRSWSCENSRNLVKSTQTGAQEAYNDSISIMPRTCSAVTARRHSLHSNVCISGRSPTLGTVRVKRIGSPQDGQVTSRSVLIVSMDITKPLTRAASAPCG